MLEKSKSRESSIELYRIIVMLLIIAYHYMVNSGLTWSGGPVDQNPVSLKSLFLLVLKHGKNGDKLYCSLI